jgi:hypothetical protein
MRNEDPGRTRTDDTQTDPDRSRQSGERGRTQRGRTQNIEDAQENIRKSEGDQMPTRESPGRNRPAFDRDR